MPFGATMLATAWAPRDLQPCALEPSRRPGACAILGSVCDLTCMAIAWHMFAMQHHMRPAAHYSRSCTPHLMRRTTPTTRCDAYQPHVAPLQPHVPSTLSCEALVCMWTDGKVAPGAAGRQGGTGVPEQAKSDPKQGRNSMVRAADFVRAAERRVCQGLRDRRGKAPVWLR